MFQFRLNHHLFSKLNPLFVFSILVVKLINQFFDLCDRPTFKMNIYHKFKVSYSIKLVIIKHALVKKLLILQVQNDIAINTKPQSLYWIAINTWITNSVSLNTCPTTWPELKIISIHWPFFKPSSIQNLDDNLFSYRQHQISKSSPLFTIWFLFSPKPHVYDPNQIAMCLP